MDDAIYERIRRMVEEKLGPGSLSRERYEELCAAGERYLERVKIEMFLRDRVGDQLVELEKRVARLESRH